MKTIYLHIGTPKTGTTHLQQFFAHNRAALLADGLYYVADQNGVSAQGIAAALGFWEDRDPHAYIERLDWFRGEMRAALDSTADSILISSEMFCETRASRRVRLLRRLRAELSSFGEHRIVVICYVRRQDLFIESRQANDIVHWGISPAVRTVDPDLVSYADYHALLSDYRRVFGDDIVVRPYEKSQLSNGDLLQDFLDQMGLLVKPAYSSPVAADQNTRVRGDLTEMIRLYNLSGLGEGRDYSFVKARFLAGLFTPGQLAKGAGGRFLVLDSKKRAEILKRYAKSNRRVATEFLKRRDGRLFRDPVAPEPADSRKGQHLLVEEITPLFMHMLMELFERGEATRNELEAETRHSREHHATLSAEVAALRQELDRLRTTLQSAEHRRLDTEARCARLQDAQRDLEWRLSCQSLDGKKIVGWGTAAAFRKHHFNNPVPLAYLIDSNPERWGQSRKSIPVRAPEALDHEAPGDTIVVVYSDAFEDISAAVAQIGRFAVIPAAVFSAHARFHAGRRSGQTARATRARAIEPAAPPVERIDRRRSVA